MIWDAGDGFADFGGGPMWLADTLGLRHIVERLQRHATTLRKGFGDRTPAALLTELAAVTLLTPRQAYKVTRLRPLRLDW